MEEWASLVQQGRIALLGIVRQEVLSGVSDAAHFRRLKQALSNFRDEPVLTADHVRAAECFNTCRSRGIQGSPVDFLLCAIAERIAAPIFTTDPDFERYALHLPLRLHPGAPA